MKIRWTIFALLRAERVLEKRVVEKSGAEGDRILEAFRTLLEREPEVGDEIAGCRIETLEADA